MKVCVITDNLYIYEHFIDLLRRKPQNAEFDFYYATWNHAFREKFGALRCADLKAARIPCDDLIAFAAEKTEELLAE
jgi:hypothetical protein